MSGIKPIPAELLTDSAVLRIPTSSGYSREQLTDVRMIRTSAITDYAAGNTRECTEIVMYFDCVNSCPADAEFTAGQMISYCGEEFEITKAELFAGTEPHHWRVTARKTGGSHCAE